jgi:hypothetical protein
MRKRFYSTAITIFLFVCGVSAQSAITCNDFCATAIHLDTLNNTLTVTLYMGGTSSDFISYPYIPAITNTQGDTIAAGTINSFGMIGNTTSDYDTQTALDSLSANFTCTIHFTYFDSNFGSATCLLPYPCTATTKINEEITKSGISVYPNPTRGLIYIKGYTLSDNAAWIVRNVYGEKIISGQLTGEKIDISNLPKGVYFLDITNGSRMFSQKIILY